MIVSAHQRIKISSQSIFSSTNESLIKISLFLRIVDITLVTQNETKPTGLSYCEQELVYHLKTLCHPKIIPIQTYPIPSRIARYVHFARTIFGKKQESSKDKIIHLMNQQLAIMLNATTPEAKVVATVYDLYSFIPEYQKTYSWRKKFQYWLVNKGLRQVDYVITISEAVRKEVSKYLSIPPERVFTFRLGVNHERFKPMRVKKAVMLKKYSIPQGKKIILYVGAEKPQKNLEALLRAVRVLKKERDDILLVKVGSSHDNVMRERHLKLIAELEIAKNVVFTESIPEEDVPK